MCFIRERVYVIKDAMYFAKGDESKSYGLAHSKKEARVLKGDDDSKIIVRYKCRGAYLYAPKVVQ